MDLDSLKFIKIFYAKRKFKSFKKELQSSYNAF